MSQCREHVPLLSSAYVGRSSGFESVVPALALHREVLKGKSSPTDAFSQAPWFDHVLV